ncbi:MAG: Smr/MutS family protein [Pseudomonadota bacterium]|nr:Smr/MutS family protein [Pseudomonadota bacterium]
MRSLGPDEAELWARVTATIRPLSREVRKPTAVPAAVEAVPAAAAPPKPPPVRRQQSEQPARPRVGSTLDGSWDKRLRSGSVEPDRIVDLHGHNLDGAWSAIDLALDRAIVGGDRVVLLITGHERPGEPPVQRGKIRAAVHDWLNASRHASKIAAVRGAHRRHGGGGSLYVILRRN